MDSRSGDTRILGTPKDYILHMIYTPVVTLHNPYNVAIEFTNMRFDFTHVPFAIKAYKNGRPKTKEFTPLGDMYYEFGEGYKVKKFGMIIHDSNGSGQPPGTTKIRMLPGEVKMFSAYADPNLSWRAARFGGDDRNLNSIADFRVNYNKTTNMRSIPGGPTLGVGFSLDYFGAAGTSSDGQFVAEDSNKGADANAFPEDSFNICLEGTDSLYFEFVPRSNSSRSGNQFTIEVSAEYGGSARKSGVIQFLYNSPKELEAAMGGGFPLRYPKSGVISAEMMRHHSLIPIKENIKTKPIAILSVQAKTTLEGSLDEKEGRFATKPWVFGHSSIGTSTVNTSNQSFANSSHEIALIGMDNNEILGDYFKYDDATGRARFITGRASDAGIEMGIQYEVPISPLQSLNTLNGANPGGASGYLPRFAQPIGNSWAHPMLKSDKVIEGDSLDHSYLANLALQDRFYFSGIADQSGSLGSKKEIAKIAESFQELEPLTDPRISFNIPDGEVPSDFTDNVQKDDAFEKIAKWQVVNGAFNINSTSVNAWKAMLGSVQTTQAYANSVSGKSASIVKFGELKEDRSQISRFRLLGDLTELGKDPKVRHFTNLREYSDDNLQTLAEAIVDQVRLKGPFLSMADFVNRQIGTGDEAQSGPLQQAIDNSNLNEEQFKRKTGSPSEPGYKIAQNQVGSYNYQNLKAGTGNSDQGAPGYLSQADILTVLGNAATPRSDTFTIRAYGEARDKQNKILASAVCEATLQRSYEYTDPKDSPEAAPENELDRSAVKIESETNLQFGRRFRVVSFKWLSRNEI